ncbi:hypothetical protein C8J56DRAFT_21755 [Mycena floridula]|nr:hypothetical protein C8J56DRAFT_21755 [Mycena floridula]
MSSMSVGPARVHLIVKKPPVSSKMEVSDSDNYEEAERKTKSRPSKRRKLNTGASLPGASLRHSFEVLIPEPKPIPVGIDEDGPCFESIINDHLAMLLESRAKLQKESIEQDDQGRSLKALTRSHFSEFIDAFSPLSIRLSAPEALALRKLKLNRERRRASVKPGLKMAQNSGFVELVSMPSSRLPMNPEILEGLNKIQTTPFQNSFLARLHGSREAVPAFAVDWDTVTPWMRLMADIREHYSLLHPARNQPEEKVAPITYTYLQACHLPQVHDLLSRVFWSGIDVTDSLDYSPERCTVVAVYNRLVVGVAIMSSPRETYITYLAVRHGWDNSQIATAMVYHLIQINPTKDISLHVSTNSAAMLLYNRFGFKAEEFIAGFYSAYLDPDSRASKNAFRLRLRHLAN